MLSLLMFSLVGFSSCSKDDDDKSNKSDLVGMWEVVSDKGWDKENGVIIYEWDQTGDEISDKWAIEFKENGKFFMYDLNGDISDDMMADDLTWKYKNNKIYLCSAEYGIEQEWTTVKELTSTTLVLEAHYKYNDGGDVYEDWSLSTFKRIK